MDYITHPRMSMIDRAAQFSPFAVLSGHGAAIEEPPGLSTKGLSRQRMKRRFSTEKLHLLVETSGEGTFTYSLPDERKSGGAYVTAVGTVKKIDPLEKWIILTDGPTRSVEDIYEITSPFDN